jgi:hypothetical protein
MGAGCGGRIEAQATEETKDAGEPSSEAEALPAARTNPLVAGSTWRGSYTCRQGPTELELRIVAVNGDLIDDALFDFDYASRSVGSFHLSGRFEPESSRVILDAGAWVTRPGGGWNTVDMDGTVDASGTVYEGKIVSAGCGAFRLTRL